jgi:hypothetical protein
VLDGYIASCMLHLWVLFCHSTLLVPWVLELATTHITVWCSNKDLIIVLHYSDGTEVCYITHIICAQ